ncbi:9595_t:CDS:1, partial [Dentiscutata heterogama]
ENISISPHSESSNKHRHSLIETESLQSDTMPLLVEDDIPQNTSDKSDLKNYK